MIYSQIGSDAVSISPPFWCRTTNKYAMRIEHRSEEYILKWTEPHWQPRLSEFPHLEPGVLSEKIVHSEPEAKIWASSQLRAFGSHSHVRKSKAFETSYPMYKIAHNTNLSQSLVSNEFKILHGLRQSTLPVVEIGDIPIIDDRGIFAFKMEELSPIEPKDIPLFYGRIENALQEVHKTGYVHTDVTISNFMLTNAGAVKLIDFGQAGRLGDELPVYHPCLQSGKQKFELDMDFSGLEKIKGKARYS